MGCEGLMKWNEDTQHSALRAMSAMCLKLEFIRASWLLGDEQSLDCIRDAVSSSSSGLDP